MLAAAVIRNLSDLTGRYEVFSKEIDVMGSVSLFDLPFNGIDGTEIVAAQRTGTAAGGNAAGADGDDGFCLPALLFSI